LGLGVGVNVGAGYGIASRSVAVSKDIHRRVIISHISQFLDYNLWEVYNRSIIILERFIIVWKFIILELRDEGYNDGVS
jgi:hypothetical protein